MAAREIDAPRSAPALRPGTARPASLVHRPMRPLAANTRSPHTSCGRPAVPPNAAWLPFMASAQVRGDTPPPSPRWRRSCGKALPACATGPTPAPHGSRSGAHFFLAAARVLSWPPLASSRRRPRPMTPMRHGRVTPATAAPLSRSLAPSPQVKGAGKASEVPSNPSARESTKVRPPKEPPPRSKSGPTRGRSANAAQLIARGAACGARHHSTSPLTPNPPPNCPPPRQGVDRGAGQGGGRVCRAQRYGARQREHRQGQQHLVWRDAERCAGRRGGARR